MQIIIHLGIFMYDKIKTLQRTVSTSIFKFTYYLLPITYYPLPITYYLLPIPLHIIRVHKFIWCNVNYFKFQQISKPPHLCNNVYQ